MKTRVLVAERDDKTVEIISSHLKKHGNIPVVAHDGEEAFRLFRSRAIDLIILSLNLPKIDGMTLSTRKIRWESNGPIIILITKEEKEKGRGIKGLKLGADDYITKPVKPKELMARVDAVLRRGKKVIDPQEIVYGHLVMNFERHEVLLNGKLIYLTPMEFEILKTMMQQPGRVFSRDQLLRVVRKNRLEYSESKRTIDVHINSLRNKIEQDGSKTRFVHTVYGSGYKFEMEESEAAEP